MVLVRARHGSAPGTVMRWMLLVLPAPRGGYLAYWGILAGVPVEGWTL